jgi:hypothetical protein
LRHSMRCLCAVTICAASACAQNTVDRAVSSLQRYLNIAEGDRAKGYQPLSQQERTELYLRSLKNPWGFIRAAGSGAIDQAVNKPSQWGQGAGAYGQRTANILGQYTVQRTVTFGISSALNEDNRYFASGKHGFFPRCGYALGTSVMARHEDGRLYPSASIIGGYAAGAFTAQLWLPGSSKAADGARSYAISLGANAGTAVLKEFLPDLLRPLVRRTNHTASPAPPTSKFPRPKK